MPSNLLLLSFKPVHYNAKLNNIALTSIHSDQYRLFQEANSDFYLCGLDVKIHEVRKSHLRSSVSQSGELRLSTILVHVYSVYHPLSRSRVS